MDDSWLIHIYEMSGQSAQDAVARSLSVVKSLAVDARSCERGFYLFVDLKDPSQGWLVYALVMIVDPRACLIHTTRGVGPTRLDWQPTAQPSEAT